MSISAPIQSTAPKVSQLPIALLALFLVAAAYFLFQWGKFAVAEDRLGFAASEFRQSARLLARDSLALSRSKWLTPNLAAELAKDVYALDKVSDEDMAIVTQQLIDNTAAAVFQIGQADISIPIDRVEQVNTKLALDDLDRQVAGLRRTKNSLEDTLNILSNDPARARADISKYDELNAVLESLAKVRLSATMFIRY